MPRPYPYVGEYPTKVQCIILVATRDAVTAGISIVAEQILPRGSVNRAVTLNCHLALETLLLPLDNRDQSYRRYPASRTCSEDAGHHEQPRFAPLLYDGNQAGKSVLASDTVRGDTPDSAEK